MVSDAPSVWQIDLEKLPCNSRATDDLYNVMIESDGVATSYATWLWANDARIIAQIKLNVGQLLKLEFGLTPKYM